MVAVAASEPTTMWGVYAELLDSLAWRNVRTMQQRPIETVEVDFTKFEESTSAQEA